MNANNILSYISKSKPIRVRVFIPFEFYALPQFLLGMAMGIGICFLSHWAGGILIFIVLLLFGLANSLRNVGIGQSMVAVRLNKAQNVSHPNGITFVVPFIDICEFFEVRLVKKDLTVSGLETKGDGFKMGYLGVYTITINPLLVHLFLTPKLIGREQEIMGYLDTLLRQASKDAVLQYSHEDLREKDTNLQIVLKQNIIDNFKTAAEEYLEAETGNKDLYTIQLAIGELKFDPEYEKKLIEKKQAEMDVEIAERERQASMIDTDAEVYDIEERGKALNRNGHKVIDLEVAKNSRLQVGNIGGSGAGALLSGQDGVQLFVPPTR